MSEKNAISCPACGARLAAEADACDLCGTPVDATGLPQREEAADRIQHNRDADAASEMPQAHEAVYCNACGWENPAGARFCSQCGEPLQEMPSAGATPVTADLPRSRAPDANADSETRRDEEPGDAASGASDAASGLTRQVGIIVGAALLIVVGLFVASTWSQQMDWGDSASKPATSAEGGGTGGGAAVPPADEGRAAPADLETLVEAHAADTMPAQIRNQAATLEEEIAAGGGDEVQSTQQKLVNLYVGAGQLGRAALVQQQVAEASGTAEDWRRTGDLLYSWMETLRGQASSPAVAEHVVQAYQRVLDADPDNLDVRTDMATAYLQTNNPMRGVEEINRVLDADPDHFQARFNKGIMLTMIGRADEAIAEFERVKEIVGPDSPYHQQADQAIQAIRERLNQEDGAS